MKKPTQERLDEFYQHLAIYRAANMDLKNYKMGSPDWIKLTRLSANAWSAVEELFGLSITRTGQLMIGALSPMEMWELYYAKKDKNNA